jgi:hypothetical protein
MPLLVLAGLGALLVSVPLAVFRPTRGARWGLLSVGGAVAAMIALWGVYIVLENGGVLWGSTHVALLALWAAAMAACGWGAWRKGRAAFARPPAWRCAGCGYDLRGLRVAACPECGRSQGSPPPGPA